MNTQIVADGDARLRSSTEFQLSREELRRDIESRYAKELAQAGFFRRMILRWKIAMEPRKERRKTAPSAKSLYGANSGRISDIESITK